MIIPLILSGGTGSRLWPVSREGHPKPFMQLSKGRSLLQETVLRAAQIPGVQSVMMVTNKDYYFQSKEAVSLLGKTCQYLLEPCARNTAPAIAMAAWLAA